MRDAGGNVTVTAIFQTYSTLTVHAIPHPTSLTLGHLPPGGRLLRFAVKNPLPITDSGNSFSLFLFLFQMPFEYQIDILGQRPGIIIRLFFDFLQNITVNGDADSFLEWFHSIHLKR